jgi:DNA/RNA-binding domain of Phe-tRNA-synthetase-like protein
MANRPERRDFDFDFASFQALIASDLVGNLGNLVNRVLSFTAKRIGQVPAAGPQDDLDRETLAAFAERRQEVERAFQSFELRQACRHILALGDIANRYVQASAPWHTIKEDRARCEASLHLACDLVRQVAQLAWPVMPERMGLVLETLGLTPTSEVLEVGRALSAPPLLFEPVEDARVEELTKRYGAEQDSGELVFEKNPEVDWPCVILELSDLKIKRRIKSLRRKIKEELAELDLAALMERPHVKAYQELLERYDQGEKHSVQNLADIVGREGKLPNINALVDVYNLYSLREGLVMGAYDRKAIRGKLLYAVATGQEHFYPVKGQDPVSIEPGEWVIKDEHDMVITRVASKQAEAVAVGTDTQSCAICVQGNPETSLEKLQEVAQEMAAEIVERCGGQWRLVFAG